MTLLALFSWEKDCSGTGLVELIEELTSDNSVNYMKIGTYSLSSKNQRLFLKNG